MANKIIRTNFNKSRKVEVIKKRTIAEVRAREFEAEVWTQEATENQPQEVKPRTDDFFLKHKEALTLDSFRAAARSKLQNSNRIIDVLVTRDKMTPDRARAKFNAVIHRINKMIAHNSFSMNQCEDILAKEFGLELDYYDVIEGAINQ